MKKFSKILSVALLVALVLSLGVANAFAADGDFLTTPENTIEVTNLTAGDSASYYQLVEWDATNSDWKLTSLGGSCGVTLASLIDGITEAEATTIADSLASAAATGNMTVSGTTASATNVAPGLYYVKAIPSENNTSTVYNPAFVSADYYEGGNSVSLNTGYSNSAVLKKSDVPFDKKVTGSDPFIDVKPGDKIPYSITTTIPSYGTLFTNPVFTITDTLSTGLELDAETAITVTYGDKSTTETNADVVITTGNPSNGFTVAFTKDYLTGLAGATPNVEITYKGKVTTAAVNNVTYMDNKAHLEFSHTPDETTDKDDITRHYTFSIDANLTGSTHGNEKTRELIKIGVDANHEPIEVFTSWVESEPWTEESPLAGATFTLTGNGVNKTFTTDNTGYISFNGLDVGTYTLTETSAPAGYVKDPDPHTVVIEATYTNTDVLASYTIKIDNIATSHYTFANDNPDLITSETTITEGAQTFPFINVKGTALPSTGGIGTTIFYVVGGVLVLAAIILLVTKKRMSE